MVRQRPQYSLPPFIPSHISQSNLSQRTHRVHRIPAPHQRSSEDFQAVTPESKFTQHIDEPDSFSKIDNDANRV